MFFGLHTTRKSERDLLMDRKGEEIIIKPEDFHKSLHRPIVCEEGTGKYYEHSISEFHDLLDKMVENPNYDYKSSDYYKKWSYKGTEINTRLQRLRPLLQSISTIGITEPVHCEATGERLDGSYRTKIAMFLGIPAVKAIMHKFKWQDIDEEFIERKLKAKNLSSPKDYYEFEFGYKDWKNIRRAGPVYKENADRYDMIVPLIKGKSVLDYGCNEGYISIQAARAGHSVVGMDHDHIHNAYLNKLIFEWIDKKSLDLEFYDEDVTETDRKADTILFLNVLYHLPRDRQEEIIRRHKGSQMIFQCNLRKERERENYYTSHPDDLKTLLDKCGVKHKTIEWKDKPIVVAK